jgi:hypothetical protein
MKYNIVIKQISFIEVDAPSEEAALKAVRDSLDPRGIYDIQVATEVETNANM